MSIWIETDGFGRKGHEVREYLKRKEKKGENKQATKTRFGTKQQAARCLVHTYAVIVCGVVCRLMLLYYVVFGAD
ncbi:hypothetical protein ACROYT_G037725 [Oculina patagonica]